MRDKPVEAALPLEAINKAAAREKSARHGHPSTLHLCWAGRAATVCRRGTCRCAMDDAVQPRMKWAEQL